MGVIHTNADICRVLPVYNFSIFRYHTTLVRIAMPILFCPLLYSKNWVLPTFFESFVGCLRVTLRQNGEKTGFLPTF